MLVLWHVRNAPDLQVESVDCNRVLVRDVTEVGPARWYTVRKDEGGRPYIVVRGERCELVDESTDQRIVPDNYQRRYRISGQIVEVFDDKGDIEELLLLVRSDHGDGGWSLHPYEDRELGPDEMTVLISGTAYWDDNHGQWDRPNEADIQTAMDALQNEYGG